MADYEENIRSGVACSGQNGLYVGTMHYLIPGGRHGLRRTPPLSFRQYKGYLEDPVLVVRSALDIAERTHDLTIKPDQLVAVSILRICARRRHVEPERTDMGHRLERVAALAVARTVLVGDEQILDVDPVAPLNSLERNISGQGIGQARRATPDMTTIKPLVHLPVTRKEAEEWPVTAAVRAAAQSPSIDRGPYIALHTQGERTIEQIVSLEDLQ